MASFDVLPSGSFRVRYCAKNPLTSTILKGTKTFRSESDARQFFESISSREADIRAGASVVNAATAKSRWLYSLQNRPARTIEHYSMVTEKFFGFLSGRIDSIFDISSSHIVEYLEHMLANKARNRTRNAHLTVIKAMFKYFVTVYGVQNAAAGVTMFKDEPPDQRFVTDEEYKVLVAAMRPLERDRLVFIANTGLRASELCGLQWAKPARLNEHCGWVDSEFKQLSIVGKGGKIRPVPLNQVARSILEKLKKSAQNSYIFISKSKGSANPLNRRALYLCCTRLASRCKLEAFGPHALRHYFATELINRGVSLFHVSKLLGHSSVKVTEQVYVHVLDRQFFGLTDVLLLPDEA